MSERVARSFLVLLGGGALPAPTRFAARLRFGRFNRHGVGRGKHLFPSGVRSARRHPRPGAPPIPIRSRPQAFKAIMRESGGHAPAMRPALFGPRGGRMAVSRLGLPRAGSRCRTTSYTRSGSRLHENPNFRGFVDFLRTELGPCRPGARRSVPRLSFSRAVALELSFFESRLYDPEFS